jgi:hypothetical protein
MASLSVLRDATIPLDTSNWIQVSKKSNMRSMSKEKLEKMKLAMTKTKVTIIIRISRGNAYRDNH